MSKRLFDLLGSLFGLVVFSPLLIGLAVAIKLDNPGPVFYLGNRIGRRGQPFKMIKFRTMVVNADKIGGPTSSANDRRLTRMGEILRRYKLDELPQLINVFLGSMSFVGPRPHIADEVAMLQADEQCIMELRPGITDYSSIKYSNEGEIVSGYPDAHQAYLAIIRPGKVWLQKKYALEHSLAVDLKILWMTISTVIGLGKPQIAVPTEIEIETLAQQFSKRAANA